MPTQTDRRPARRRADSPWLTKREAAAYLKISVDTLNRWEADKRVIFHKVADLQSVRLHRDELDALIRPVEKDA